MAKVALTLPVFIASPALTEPVAGRDGCDVKALADNIVSKNRALCCIFASTDEFHRIFDHQLRQRFARWDGKLHDDTGLQSHRFEPISGARLAVRFAAVGEMFQNEPNLSRRTVLSQAIFNIVGIARFDL